MKPVKKQSPSMTSTLLKDLGRYGQKGGPTNEGQLSFALKQFVDKYKKFEAGEAEDKLLQQLYDEDPTRLHTFYGLRDDYLGPEGDAQHRRIIDGKGDIEFYLADGSGAGLEYPEKILPGEEPIYRMNKTGNRKGQDLVGKYVRDKNGQRRAVYFSDEAVRILNEQNYMNR
tara:strand:+ start:947 stop:1459 length:513 start_codon:yes stop_codon:yes gene_type:complete